MAILYADSSALVKLVRVERETDALVRYLGDDSHLVSAELIYAEVPRAIHRAAAANPGLPLGDLLGHAHALLAKVATLPIDEMVLVAAGALTEPSLRALDAIHVVAAVELSPIDAFVTYDERQAAVARLAGLATIAPGR